jgi:hypothetical protein
MNGKPKENEESLFQNIQDEINSSEVINKISKRKHGRNNREKIMMNITTFKKLCLRAGTKKLMLFMIILLY